jgi:omega-6 fatty acid desaturase (delta-12 desaturase)
VSVIVTDVALAVIFWLLFTTIGVKTRCWWVPLSNAVRPVSAVYVQHQFEDAYWERGEDWDYVAAAMQGSSFFKLPRVLQWFSGNIGFHHIHHLSPLIPNYRLPKAFREQPVFQRVNRLTLRSSLRSLRLRLYDEQSRRLVGFREV